MNQERGATEREALLPEAAELYRLLGRVARALRRSGDLGALSPSAAATLATLTRNGPMRLTELAATERVSAPTMSRMVTALEKAGYIVRSADPEDRRAQLLEVTDDARARVGGLTSARIQRFAVALTRLTLGQRDTLTETLAVLEQALDD